MKPWTHERLRPKRWKGERVRWKQFKYNGHRFTVYKQRDGRLVGFEREIRSDLEMTVKRPKIVEYDWWKALEQIPPMSSVDGELYVLHGHRSGNAGDAAHAIAECLPTLEFVPFAVPWWKGVDLSTVDLEYAQRLLTSHSNGGIGLKLAPFYPLFDHDDFELLCKDAANLGIEGFVLKEANYLGWWKVKPTQSVDCVVTGFKDGDGKYIGLVGSLKVSVWINGELTEIASVSGMDDETRLDIDEKKDLGRVVEVEYQELGNGRRLINSRFERWRDDKPAEQCKYDWEEL